MSAGARAGTCLVVLAAALAAVATTAPGATSPPRFLVTIKASQTASWSISEATGCGGTISGSGNETTTYQTPRPITIGEPALLNGLHSALSVDVRSTRAGSLTDTLCQLVDGNCVPNNLWDEFSRPNPPPVPCGTPLVADTSTCGTQQFTLRAGSGLYVAYGRDPGDPHEQLDVQLAVEQPIWGTGCPGYVSKRPVGIFANPTMPLATLLRRRTTVLSGTYDCPSAACVHQEDPRVTLHATWMVKFQRLP